MCPHPALLKLLNRTASNSYTEGMQGRFDDVQRFRILGPHLHYQWSCNNPPVLSIPTAEVIKAIDYDFIAWPMSLPGKGNHWALAVLSPLPESEKPGAAKVALKVFIEKGVSAAKDFKVAQDLAMAISSFIGINVEHKRELDVMEVRVRVPLGRFTIPPGESLADHHSIRCRWLRQISPPRSSLTFFCLSSSIHSSWMAAAKTMNGVST